MQETRVQSLGWRDPLEKEIAAHFSILAWEIPWTEEPGGLLHGLHRVGYDLATNYHQPTGEVPIMFFLEFCLPTMDRGQGISSRPTRKLGEEHPNLHP